MNHQITQRLYITASALSLIWLLCMGVINLTQINEVRSSALSDCIKDNFQLYEFCLRKTNDEVRLSFLNYISPFFPSIFLMWISWLLKYNFQINPENISPRLRKIVIALIYVVSVLAFIIPFSIVMEKEVDRLYTIIFYHLFLMPWLAITWISIPIFFQKLLDKEMKFTEFNGIYRVILTVAASPFLAILLIFIRQEVKI